MLTLEHVSKSYGGLPVLNDLSLTLSEGEILALIGPSGCGKSTLLNIISGLVRPDAGSVSGADVKMSYMFQSARLLPWRTVRENIRIVRQDAAEEEAAAIIAAVGLQGFADYYPGQLSGGMARRCALARAFLFGGAIFLMDEPFSGLDYGIRMEMVDMLLSIWRREKPGVLFVTHDIAEALRLGTRVLVMANGEIQQYATPEEILRAPATDFVRQLVAGERHACHLPDDRLADCPYSGAAFTGKEDHT